MRCVGAPSFPDSYLERHDLLTLCAAANSACVLLPRAQRIRSPWVSGGNIAVLMLLLHWIAIIASPSKHEVYTSFRDFLRVPDGPLRPSEGITARICW